MTLCCHCERSRLSGRAWQSHPGNTRLLRRFTPRKDTLLNSFVLEDLKSRILKRLLQTLIHSDHDFGGVSDPEKELGIVLNVESFHLLLHPVDIPGHL